MSNQLTLGWVFVRADFALPAFAVVLLGLVGEVVGGQVVEQVGVVADDSAALEALVVANSGPQCAGRRARTVLRSFCCLFVAARNRRGGLLVVAFFDANETSIDFRAGHADVTFSRLLPVAPTRRRSAGGLALQLVRRLLNGDGRVLADGAAGGLVGSLGFKIDLFDIDGVFFEVLFEIFRMLKPFVAMGAQQRLEDLIDDKIADLACVHRLLFDAKERLRDGSLRSEVRQGHADLQRGQDGLHFLVQFVVAGVEEGLSGVQDLQYSFHGLGFESRTDDVVSKVEVRRQVTGGGEKLTQELGAVAEHQLVGLEHRPENKTSQVIEPLIFFQDLTLSRRQGLKNLCYIAA